MEQIKLTTELYKKYANLINSAAWKAAKVCGEDFEELRSRGNLIFCEATKSYNPEKGAFSTHLTWKLLTLKQACGEQYAPKTCKDERTFWSSLESKVIGKDDQEINSDPIEASTEYTKKISQTDETADWGARIEGFESYLDRMDEDSRQLCNDILDGVFEEPEIASAVGRKAYIAKMSKIPVNRFYSKRYIQLGWTKQRTQVAVDNLRQMVRLWMSGKMPCKLTKASTKAQPELF